MLSLPSYTQNVMLEKTKAQGILKRVFDFDEYYLPAVLMMVKLNRLHRQDDEAIALLRKQVAQQPSSKLYTLLGDILSAKEDPSEAVESYTIAIK